MSAKPLSVPSSVGKSPITSPASEAALKKLNGRNASPANMTQKPEDISSPHELTAFVESLLSNLETNFEQMSNQMLEKLDQMSTRVESLEMAIQDLINDTYVPATPVPTTGPGTPSTGLTKVDE